MSTAPTTIKGDLVASVEELEWTIATGLGLLVAGSAARSFPGRQGI
jgi:hypothetical protein